MKNIIKFKSGKEDYEAEVVYDPEIEMFRGAFLGLSGGADFYAKDVEGLKREGQISIDDYLEACAKHGIKPRKENKSNFALRLDPPTYNHAATAAASAGVSMNQFLVNLIRRGVAAYA